MNKIRAGVVGVGYFGQFHAEKYANLNEVELVGVVDIDATRAKEIAKRYRTQPFFRHEDLLNQVQIVSIAVPTPFHYSVTKDFLLNGIDVLLEKPISNNLEEADELIGLAQSTGSVFQVGHLERFNGALSVIAEWLKHPRFIECHRLGPFSGRGAEVDVVLDLMIHDIDILLSLIRSKVKRIQAVGIPILTPYLDMANARIEFENGSVADLTASRVSKEKIRKARIYQTDGILSIDYLSQKLSISKKGIPHGKKRNPEMITEEIMLKKIDLLESEIHSFIQSVKDRTPAQVSGLDGKRALDVALQIVQEIHHPNRENR
ncbi:MAG: Gfo/Idh/MocA family oxidoreductase [Syntrophaceae bacterium]|nr:Gfo/Idh/MocA family oxidoreductase [Syntrophaceae bacterium]